MQPSEQLSDRQQEVLKVLGVHGQLRSGDVGCLVHANVHYNDWYNKNRLAIQTLVSLKDRGLVVEPEPNLWRLATPTKPLPDYADLVTQRTCRRCWIAKMRMFVGNEEAKAELRACLATDHARRNSKKYKEAIGVIRGT